MIDQLLQDLINFIKNASPVIWETFVRQVYADAVSYLFWALILIIGAIILYRLGAKWSREYKKADDYSDLRDAYSTCAYGVMVLFICLIPVFMNSAIKMFINPNYYAIQSIITLISGK